MASKIGIEVSDNNLFINAWNDGVDNENYCERNDECISYDIIVITENNLQGDKGPMEEIAKSAFAEFKLLNEKFIAYTLFTMV